MKTSSSLRLRLDLIEKAEPNPEVLAQIAAAADPAALLALFKSLDAATRATHMDAFSARKKELA